MRKYLVADDIDEDLIPTGFGILSKLLGFPHGENATVID